MEVKPGYKRSEVGVIPEEWDVRRFCEIGTLTKGRGLLKEDIKHGGSIPAIPYTSLYTDFSEILDYSLIKWFIDDETKTVIVREPCLLFASSSNMEANTGKASAIVGTNPVAIGREVIIFKTSADCEFISYLLSTGPYRKRTLTLARGTTIKHVYPATFYAYPIAHPPVPEQRAIAKALSDVEGLLAGLDRLIHKKRDLKQAALQQLLTGQTRLPGFYGEWKVKRLDALADIRSGGTPSTGEPSFWDGDIPWCTPTDITALRGHKYLGETARMITELGLAASSAEIIPAQSVIMTSRATIGECAINDFSVSTNQGFKNFVPFESTDVDYLYYLLGTQKQGFISLCGGSTFLEIGKAQLAAYKVRLPSTKAEQTAIAKVLTDMDTELAALERRREKTRAIKQGMMQELLTGKVRLV